MEKYYPMGILLYAYSHFHYFTRNTVQEMNLIQAYKLNLIYAWGLLNYISRPLDVKHHFKISKNYRKHKCPNVCFLRKIESFEFARDSGILDRLTSTDKRTCRDFIQCVQCIASSIPQSLLR